MDTLQARFRDKASAIVQNTPTITVAMGRGRMFTVETCYVVGTSDEMYCIVKPNPAIIEAVQDDAQVAFAVNHEFPNQLLQGTGRAFFLGGMDRHAEIREQALAKVPDATTFLTTIRNLGVLKIIPDQIAVTDDSNLGLGPRPVYVPEAARTLPDQRRRWLSVVGVPAWPLVCIPVLVAALLAADSAVAITWWLLAPLFAVALLLQVGTILLATYTGFHRHTDRGQALGSSRVLREGLLPARYIRGAGLLCLAVGAILGLFLVGIRGTPLLAMGLIGVVGGLLYAGWPLYLTSRVFEEAVVFLCLGPLVVLGSYFALTGVLHTWPLLVSLPLGLLAASILHANHLRTFPEDVHAKQHTLAVELRWEGARLLFYGVVGLAYFLALLLILTGVLPGWSWLTFLSLFLAGRGVLSVWQASTGQTQALTGLDRQMAQTYLAFGILLIFGLLLG
jgi:1,4-dihydroxy-2-naphthoate polyprenyltransferase